MPFSAIIIYIVVMGSVFTFRLLPEDYVEAFNDGVIALVCLSGCYYLSHVYRRFKPNDPVRYCWLLFGIGLFGEGIGHVWYSAQQFMVGEVVNFPNTADFFIMVGAVCYVASLWNFRRLVKSNELLVESRLLFWVANLVFLLLLALNVIYIILPTLALPDEPLWLRLLYLYYPVFDTFIAYFCLHLALSFISMGQSPVAKPWVILVIAFLIFLVTDSAFAYIDLAGNYHPYLFINPGWGLAYLCVSHAAYVQSKLMDSVQSIEDKLANFNWDDDDIAAEF